MKEDGDKTMKRKFWLLLVAAFTAVTVAHSWQTKAQPAVIATQPQPRKKVLFNRLATSVHSANAQGAEWPQWQAGQLEIHHINTRNGNAAFFIFPDGTTMLVDAGELRREEFERRNAPLKIVAADAGETRTPGQLIADYIRAVFPAGRPLQLDYALITHFHEDHYGAITTQSKMSRTGKFRLSGLTEVAEQIPIRVLLDRNYPAYDFPLDLRTLDKAEPGTFRNYLAFVEHFVQTGQMKAEALRPGSKSQIRLQSAPEKYPQFIVRNVKSNGIIWTGKGEETLQHIPDAEIRGKNLENPLSNALKISYGKFDYFTGGDNTGLRSNGKPAAWPSWMDVETPMARAVGPVEALSLNHHGNRDATNAFFLDTLAPQVTVQQLWCSDQPGQEVMHRLIEPLPSGKKRLLFSTNMRPETQVTLGPWLTNNYQSTFGHVVIRVYAPGDTFETFVINDKQGQPVSWRSFGLLRSE